jgi:hypothetical protein
MELKKMNFLFFIFLICSIASFSNSKTLKIKNNQNEKYFEALLKWNKTNGAKFEKIHVKFHNDINRYLIASNEIKKGETVLEIPDQLIMTDYNQRILPLCKEYDVKKRNCLATYLCTEAKKPDNFYQPYTKFLLNDFPYHPLYFNEKLKQLIKGSQLQLSWMNGRNR